MYETDVWGLGLTSHQEQHARPHVDIVGQNVLLENHISFATLPPWTVDLVLGSGHLDILHTAKIMNVNRRSLRSYELIGRDRALSTHW